MGQPVEPQQHTLWPHVAGWQSRRTATELGTRGYRRGHNFSPSYPSVCPCRSFVPQRSVEDVFCHQLFTRRLGAPSAPAPSRLQTAPSSHIVWTVCHFSVFMKSYGCFWWQQIHPVLSTHWQQCPQPAQPGLSPTAGSPERAAPLPPLPHCTPPPRAVAGAELGARRVAETRISG